MKNTLRLVGIGLAAGFFSALFGVGGGIVAVPLLILVARYPERAAMATSLAAIGLIALVGSISYGLHGNLHPGYAALLGVPAAAGSVAGAVLQQRLATRTLTLSYSVVLAAAGVYLAR